MKQILLLLPTGFEILEAAAFIDIFGWNEVAGDKSTLLVCGGKTKNIPTSFGHTMQADKLLKDISSSKFDALALPGGFTRYDYYDAKKDDEICSLIRDFAVEEKPIAAVCTGALLLGAAGILKNRKATTYAGEEGRWQTELAAYGVMISKKSPCVDGNIITSQNPTSAPYVALCLLEILTSKKNTIDVADMMGYTKAPRS